MTARDEPLPRDDATAAVSDSILPPIVLLLDIEPAMADLFEAWLSRDGLLVRRHADAGERIALILIDLPFPRRDGAERLRGAVAQLLRGRP